MPSSDIARDGREWHVSVSVCTYKRHRLLRQALESLLLAQRPDDAIRYEVIRYVFEQRQGLPHNTAVEAALAPIVAFTDNDVCVAPTLFDGDTPRA